MPVDSLRCRTKISQYRISLSLESFIYSGLYRFISTAVVALYLRLPRHYGHQLFVHAFFNFQRVKMPLVANHLPPPFSQRAQHPHDEEPDQIGSNASTPPGAQTPRPDYVDKRLPGIIHSYFGQVRDTFRSRPKSARNSIDHTNIPISEKTEDDPRVGEEPHSEGEKQRRTGGGGDQLPTAPASPTDAEVHDVANVPSLPLLSNERIEAPPQSQSSELGPSQFSTAYPTPPTSSNSSIHRTSKDESHGRNTSIDLLVKPTAHMAVDATTDGANPSPKGSRRPTLTLSPLSNVVVASTVTASHISNPVSDLPSSSQSPTATPAIASLSASRRASASSSPQRRENGGLTQSASALRQAANTPPQTPRTHSQEGQKQPQSGTATPRSGTDGPKGATVGPVLGKLSVEISEGKGLRPSVDPYVVCQFQWAEFISEGPRSPTAERAPGFPKPSSIAIQRTSSERGGTPQAIPMRSRQSSHSGRDASSDFQETTDPKWQHATTL